MQLDIQEIKKIIPHRFPFLLIDKVTDLKPNERLVAVKNVSINEPYFVGHFPDEKIMPGVLIVEALAQAGCVFFYYSQNCQGKSLHYYLGKVEARFLAPVVPGDQLKLVVSPIKMMKSNCFIMTRALVQEKLVAEAKIVFSIKDVS